MGWDWASSRRAGVTNGGVDTVGKELEGKGRPLDRARHRQAIISRVHLHYKQALASPVPDPDTTMRRPVHLVLINAAAAVVLLAAVADAVRFPAQPEAVDRASRTAASGPAEPPPVSFRQIVDAHLYGSPAEEAPAPAVVVDAAPTTLDLRLLGIVSSTDAGQARALIAVEDGPGRYFSVNQLISGTDARIRGITADQVLIERGGRLERVLLWSPENMARANEGAQLPPLPGVAVPAYPDLSPGTPPPASLLPIPARAGAAHDTP